jgi:hypothetical protein
VEFYSVRKFMLMKREVPPALVPRGRMWPNEGNLRSNGGKKVPLVGKTVAEKCFL